MHRPLAASVTLLILSLAAAPTAAQQIPDNIPDLPGESPADRARDRLEERHRGTLSRFFAGGGFGMDPVTAGGPLYQANLRVGLSLPSGDALFLSMSSRQVAVDRDSEVGLLRAPDAIHYWGVGYGMAATRLLGDTQFARRSALNLGLGAMFGDVSGMTVEVAPTYDLLRGVSWAVPVGIRLNHVVADNGEVTTSRTFLGLDLGVRWHFGQRERLELR